MKSWREWVIQYGTYLLVFLTPILYLGQRYIPYTTSKTFFFYGAVEIVFTLWLYQLFIDTSYRFSKKDFIIFIPFFLYISWITIAGIFGADPEMSLWSSLRRGTGLLTMYHVTALVLVIASLVKKHGLIKYGYKFLNWFIGGVSVLAISVWLGNEGFNLPFKFLELSKGGGLMGNSSLAATVLLFGLFFEAFLLTATNITKKYKIVLSVAIALIIFSPLFINLFGASLSARGALLGIVVSAVSFIPFFLTLSKKRIAKTIGVSLICVGVFAFIFSWNKLMTPDTAIHQKVVDSAGESRFIFWEISQKALTESPILGFGPENYRIAYQTHFDPHLYILGSTAEIWNDRAHNIFFETGVAGGWPALILYFSFLFSLFFGIYKAFEKGKISKTQTAILGSLIVAYFFQNLFVFDSTVSLIALGILTGIIFGMCAGDVEKEKDKTLKKNNRYVVASVLVLLFIPTWVSFAWMPSRKSVDFARVLEMSLNERPDYYADLLNGSPVGNSFEVSAIAEDSYNLYTNNQNEIKADERLLAYSLKDLEKFTEYLEIVAERQPADYRIRLNLARLYNIYAHLSGNTEILEKALEVEEEALVLVPNDPQIYWVKAVTQFRSNDLEGSRATMKKAIEIAPYIDFSHELLDTISKKTP